MSSTLSLLSSDASYVDGTLISNSLMFPCFQTCIFTSIYLQISHRHLNFNMTKTNLIFFHWYTSLLFFLLSKGTTAIIIYRVASEDSMKDSCWHLFLTPFCTFSSSSDLLSPYWPPPPPLLCSRILDLLFTLMTSLFICFQQTNFLRLC